MSSPSADYNELIYRKPKKNLIENCNARNYGSTQKLVRWTSWKPNNPFAPFIDIPFWIDSIPINFCETILTDIKSIENDLTDWKKYNIFSWTDKFVFVHKLLLLIKSSLYQYAGELQYELPEKVWIRGWMNIMNEGDSLPIHSHAFHENSFISGNILLTNSEISTEYVIPNYSTYYGNYLSKSRSGSVILFPSWVEHFVPPVKKKRYCLAFDFYTNESIEYLKQNASGFDPMMLSTELEL